MEIQTFETQLEQYLDTHLDSITEQIMALVRIPSISHQDAHLPEARRVLEATTALAQQYGFSTQIFDTPGRPVFVATLAVDPSRPWVLVYNHMDVQPAAEPQWRTEPFEPVLQDGRIYGRGSTDDKGPALTTLHAIHFLHQHGYPLPNIQVVYETEEEIGSPHFGHFLDTYREHLQTPASILVSDTIFEGEHPAITYRLKGLLRTEAELVTGTQDLHSGMLGGAAINPLNVLIQALSRCVDAQGRVTVPGVLADLPEISQTERETLRHTASIFDLEKLKADTGGAQLYTEDALELLKRLWLLPTLEVHGFEGAQSEPGTIKTALPYAVRAKITMRLVAGQEPQRVFEQLQACLQAVHPGISLSLLSGVKGCFSDIQNPFMQAAQAACLAGFGREAVFVGGGGTIGALPEFERVFPEAPLVLIAQSLMSDGYHAPNENFQLKQIRHGFKTMAHYLQHIASLEKNS